MNFYYYKADVVRVIDGDTIVCNIDLGFDTWLHNEHVRLYGIDTPEIRTKDLDEKRKGYEAKDFVERIIADNFGEVVLETFYDSGGKYGRVLANVYIVTDDDVLVSVNEQLLNEGLAEVYKP